MELDRFMHAHAHVEDCINRLKDSGLERFPFSLFDANSAWLAAVSLAADPVRWFQLLCLRGELRRAKPKALRWRLWHAPARLVSFGRRTILRLLDSWPDAHALLDAHRRIALLTRPSPGGAATSRLPQPALKTMRKRIAGSLPWWTSPSSPPASAHPRPSATARAIPHHPMPRTRRA